MSSAAGVVHAASQKLRGGRVYAGDAGRQVGVLHTAGFRCLVAVSTSSPVSRDSSGVAWEDWRWLASPLIMSPRYLSIP